MVTHILNQLDKPLQEFAQYPVADAKQPQPVVTVLERHQALGLYGMGRISKGPPSS